VVLDQILINLKNLQLKWHKYDSIFRLFAV
jgi:hypothetical protein